MVTFTRLTFRLEEEVEEIREVVENHPTVSFNAVSTATNVHSEVISADLMHVQVEEKVKDGKAKEWAKEKATKVSRNAC